MSLWVGGPPKSSTRKRKTTTLATGSEDERLLKVMRVASWLGDATKQRQKGTFLALPRPSNDRYHERLGINGYV